jgi:hypothetical protein
MKTIFERFLPVFSADGGGAAPAASAPSGGGAPSAAGGAAAPAGAPAVQGGQPVPNAGALENSGGWKAPDFLPEHLRGKDMAETFEKVTGDWKAFRDRFAQVPQPGKDVAEYQFQPSEKAAPYLGDLSKDPVFDVARQAALKAGLPPKAFSDFVGTLYDTLAEGGQLPKPYNLASERDALVGPDARFMSDAQKDEIIKPILTQGVAFLEGLKREGAISDAGFAQLGAMLDTAEGAKTLAAIAKRIGSPQPGGVAMGGDPAARGLTPESVRAMQKDPRANPNSASYDPKFRDAMIEGYRKVFS